MSFEIDGYAVFRDFWPQDLLKAWEDCICDIYAMQAAKLGAPAAMGLDDLLKWFEEHDKAAGYEVLSMLEMTPEAKRITSHPDLLETAAQMLGTMGQLFTFGPHPFINLPGSKRLLYRWHSESTYYPKRRRFLNVWFPIFGDKDENNGTMWVARGSHIHPEWQFAEYQGYDKSGQAQHFVQYEIPPQELEQFEKVPIRARRGDLVVFARSLAHTSTPNQSDRPSYASVLRVFDYSKDLTVSGDPAVQPYVGNGRGRPGMKL